MHRFVMVLLCWLPSALLAAGHFQPVNLNAASKEQLMVLPGVGEKLAQRIVSHREEKGSFASLDDLLLIKGLRPKLLDDLSGKIEVGKMKKVMVMGKGGKPNAETTPKVRTEQEIRELLSVFDREPKAKQVQEQALRYASAEPSRIDEWLKRARIAP